MTSDEELRDMLIESFKNNTSWDPERIKYERIKLKIPPRVVHDKFEDAYIRYMESKHHMKYRGARGSGKSFLELAMILHYSPPFNRLSLGEIYGELINGLSEEE